jgi:hypothetical protein
VQLVQWVASQPAVLQAPVSFPGNRVRYHVVNGGKIIDDPSKSANPMTGINPPVCVTVS